MKIPHRLDLPTAATEGGVLPVTAGHPIANLFFLTVFCRTQVTALSTDESLGSSPVSFKPQLAQSTRN